VPLPVNRSLNMEMKQFLIDMFKYNDWANRKIMEKIKELPDSTRAVELYSHLINSMLKWPARFNAYPEAPVKDWWKPVYPIDKLEEEWGACLKIWLDLLESKSEEDMFVEVKMVGDDGRPRAALLKDIALQLNYHSIHHRANIQTIIRAQGLQPDFLDYIGTVVRQVR
jgi:uncharacterized damage-inducible protein DinB